MFKKNLKTKLFSIKNFFSFIRFGESWRTDTFVGSKNFYIINKFLNFKENKKRKKIKNKLTENLNTKINQNKGFAKFKLSEIKNYNLISNSLKKLRDDFNFVNWNEIERNSEKKYLLNKKLDLNEDVEKVVNFFLPVVSDYLGSLPLLIDFSYWYSPNKIESNKGSQNWHLDHEDIKQIKIYIPIDKEINEENGSMTFVGKKTTHEIFHKIQKKEKNLVRSKKIDDELFNQKLSISDEVFKCKINPDEVFLIDTCNCYHYGSRKAYNPRKLLQMHFISKFSSSVPFIFTKKFKQDEIYENVITNYNYSFSWLMTKYKLPWWKLKIY